MIKYVLRKMRKKVIISAPDKREGYENIDDGIHPMIKTNSGAQTHNTDADFLLQKKNENSKKKFRFINIKKRDLILPGKTWVLIPQG